MKVFGEDEQFLSVTYYNNGVKTETWEYLYWESNGNTKQLNIYYGNGKLKEVIEYNEDGSANREIKYDENGQTIEKRLYWENGNVKEETYRTATNEVIRQYRENGTKLSETKIIFNQYDGSGVSLGERKEVTEFGEDGLTTGITIYENGQVYYC